jgi:GMP synthase (glutamine-hydrolysing)
MHDVIYVLDFGSQFSHLIVRRIRELGVYAELVPYNISLKVLTSAKGIILSGGPQNLSSKGALRVDKEIFNLDIPILGICYGLQLMAFELGGTVRSALKKEYGPTDIIISRSDDILTGLGKKQRVWMSHGDQVTKLPRGFVTLASSDNCRQAAIAHKKKRLYGLQFHPEVIHTVNGLKILKNFVDITGARRTWSMKDFVAKKIIEVRQMVGQGKAICAMSGGVDSSVAATLVHKAIGRRLTCILVDTGLMSQNEIDQIIKTFRT